MYSDNTPAKEHIEYGGERLINPYAGNYSMKQIKTDTSGNWQCVGRIGRIKFYQENHNQ